MRAENELQLKITLETLIDYIVNSFGTVDKPA